MKHHKFIEKKASQEKAKQLEQKRKESFNKLFNDWLNTKDRDYYLIGPRWNMLKLEDYGNHIYYFILGKFRDFKFKFLKRFEYFTKGVSSRITWNLDHEVDKFIYDHLKYLMLSSHSYPSQFEKFENYQEFLNELLVVFEVALYQEDILTEEFSNGRYNHTSNLETIILDWVKENKKRFYENQEMFWS